MDKLDLLMKRLISVVMTIMLVVSSVIVFTGCGGAEPAKQPEAEEQVTEMPAAAEAAEQPEAEGQTDQTVAEEPAANETDAPEPGVEVM